MASELVKATADATPPEDQTVVDWLVQYEDKIAAQLGSALESSTFVQAVISSFRATPQLQMCTRTSVLGAVMLAAQLRLEVGPALGQFHLTPRRLRREDNTYVWACVPIIGYRGYAALAYRSGLVEKVETLLVREGDTFTVWADSDKGRQFRWEPSPEPEDTRPLTHVVGIAKIRDAGTVWASLTKTQVDARRPRQKTPVWDEHYDAMAAKTAIRALAPLLPMNTYLASAMKHDEQQVEIPDGVDELTVIPDSEDTDNDD